ncbi:MAG TPA: chemotaxis protein CheB [Steroidobacteraceae bacterium]|nr:chemotaxis protein CheB [Steroidobacteraceae bacterium]
MPSENNGDGLPGTRRITVVGIGASAGGIEALREFFDAVPPDLGLAYVVIVHLSPDHASELAPIIGRRTKMPVVEVSEQRLELKRDHVYVISPDHRLEISHTSIGGIPYREPHGRRTAIDTFFRSLAETYGDGFAIVLSGGGSDGAVGAKAVKEAGGLVLVQDPQEAAHDGMPQSVIQSEIADLVLPVREIARRLGDLALQKERLAPLMPPPPGDAAIGEGEELVLKRIFDLVRLRTNHDFSRYKRATVLRRLARRMQLSHCAGLEQYLTFLKDRPEEVQALFDDLLISVTSFFRDPAAWEALRAMVVGPLVEQSVPNQPIRVWVPGCATGEEAYTVAMLFREEITRRDLPCELVIFGSDVDQGALATAREGVYPAAIVADVSESRLARYFRAEGDHYRISGEIRDSVVFAAHSVLRDPPFSKLHLISCRNLLIYLDRELQQQLQNVFRYGLRDDGYLFIGVSETADPELFEPLDKQHRLFRTRPRLPGPAVRMPQLPAMPFAPAIVERGRERGVRPRRSVAEVHIEALEEMAPPSALVDEQWSVEHLSESAGRFLQPRGGAPTQIITELVRPELVDELRSALHHAFELGAPCLSPFVPVRFNGTPQLVGVLVQPRPRGEGREQHVLVTFLEAGKADSSESSERTETSDSIVLSLRDKLRIAEQRLETMRQEHGLAYEDLRAANEELQSLNEEYRSTTEELETSKEELQSVNEELQTVNHELKMKLEEVSRANNDLENFMAATDIPMLFLDRGLGIKRYTAPLRQIFNVKSHDQGRPIGDLTHNMEYQDLERDAARVLHDLVPAERQVKLRTGESLAVRIRPYRTAEDKIDGVVVTFVKLGA